MLRRILITLTGTVLVSCGGGGGTSPSPSPQPPVPPVADEPEFIPEGLAGLVISRIESHGNRLFAATDDGLFSKFVGQDSWDSTGLAGLKVQDVVFIDGEHWLASVFDGGANPFTNPALYETVNGGSNWSPVDNDFGGGAAQSEGIFALHYDANSHTLYGTGTNALASSENGGRSWQLLDGAWDVIAGPLEALELHSANGQIWFGGQNAIEEMVLRRYDIADGSAQSFPRLLPSPATIKGITFDHTNSDRVLASGEGGILESLDNGATWTNLLGDVDSRFYFEVVLDPQNSAWLYTAGWDKNFDDPQALILEISRDNGASWEGHELPDAELFGGAWSLLAVTENDETVIYIGLYRGGIMKVLPPG